MSKYLAILTLTLAICLVGAPSQAQDPTPVSAPPGATATLGTVPSVLGTRQLTSTSHVEMTSGTYAIFHTSEGDFLVQLADKIAPITVRNFVAYATGQKAWRHPVTLTESTRPLYSNTNIYRIVPNSMIFGGDPVNRGEADSGTQLPLETTPGVNFDQPGLLAMDSSGNKMSGSRWFITLRPFPERNDQYTIFGKVIGGLDLVQRISNKPVSRPQLPLDPVMIYFVEIVKVPAGRVASGDFKQENGMTVLRIDPNFADAPPGELPDNIFAKPETSADTESNAADEASTETETIDQAEENASDSDNETTATEDDNQNPDDEQ